MADEKLTTVEDLKKLAADFADRAQALGARAVIAIVSIDDPNGVGVHSLYGYAHRGPCLDLDGLARRITQATDANWRHTISGSQVGAVYGVAGGAPPPSGVGVAGSLSQTGGIGVASSGGKAGGG